MSSSERSAVVPPAGRRASASAVGGVEVLARLVEDEDREVGQQGAGDGDALALAAGEPRAVLADLGGEPGGQASSQSSSRDPAEDGAQLGVGGLAPGEAEVLGERRVEEVGVLGDQPDDAADVVAGAGGRAARRRAATDPPW